MYSWYLKLQNLPWHARLLIILTYFFLFEMGTVFMTVIHREKGFASLLAGAGILAALSFEWKKALAIEWSLLWVYLAINIFLKGLCPDQAISFVTGTFLDFFLIATVGLLRRGWKFYEELNKKACALAEMKDQFILNVHHELRNPLTTILGSLSILRDGGLEEDEYELFLNHAIYSSNELQRIAENVLDAIRAESDVSRAWINDFELNRVAGEVLRSVDTQDHPLRIDIAESVIVKGDSQQTGQVIRNLISNCLKYSPKGAPVVVKVWQDDLYGRMSIRDKGPGIAPEHMPMLFQKFSRLAPDIAGPVRGIGLGLYICRRLIEQMEGQIWVESVVGEGSIFYISLPRATIEVTDGKLPCIILQK